MKLRRALTASFALAMGFLGCMKSLPTEPSALTEGIVVYEHADYMGKSAHITTDLPSLAKFSGPCRQSGGGSDWNDCISSVRVAPGWSATLYGDTEYRDLSFEITADVPNLAHTAHDCPAGGMNDCVSSVRVRHP